MSGKVQKTFISSNSTIETLEEGVKKLFNGNLLDIHIAVVISSYLKIFLTKQK